MTRRLNSWAAYVRQVLCAVQGLALKPAATTRSRLGVGPQVHGNWPEGDSCLPAAALPSNSWRRCTACSWTAHSAPSRTLCGS